MKETFLKFKGKKLNIKRPLFIEQKSTHEYVLTVAMIIELNDFKIKNSNIKKKFKKKN